MVSDVREAHVDEQRRRTEENAMDVRDGLGEGVALRRRQRADVLDFVGWHGLMLWSR